MSQVFVTSRRTLQIAVPYHGSTDQDLYTFERDEYARGEVLDVTVENTEDRALQSMTFQDSADGSSYGGVTTANVIPALPLAAGGRCKMQVRLRPNARYLKLLGRHQVSADQAKVSLVRVTISQVSNGFPIGSR